MTPRRKRRPRIVASIELPRSTRTIEEILGEADLVFEKRVEGGLLLHSPKAQVIIQRERDCGGADGIPESVCA